MPLEAILRSPFSSLRCLEASLEELDPAELEASEVSSAEDKDVEIIMEVEREAFLGGDPKLVGSGWRPCGFFPCTALQWLGVEVLGL